VRERTLSDLCNRATTDPSCLSGMLTSPAQTESCPRFYWRPALLILWLLLWAPVNAPAGSVEIIVHPDQASTQIDRSLLRALFSMRLRQWPSGALVQVFVLPDHDEVTDLFCREQLGTYPYVMRATWDRMIFTGTGLAPIMVKSEQEMRDRVRSTPGAIGYVRSADKSDRLPSLPNFQLASLVGNHHG
jgi:hypothetical protein